jgi:hypothetical protein
VHQEAPAQVASSSKTQADQLYALLDPGHAAQVVVAQAGGRSTSPLTSSR